MAAKTATRKTASRGARESTKDVYDIVTEQIVKLLDEGTVPWRQPWTSAGFARSLSTRKTYRGINIWLLAIAQIEGGYGSPWWGTYNKIAELGGQVRKGETGTLVVFWKRWLRKVTDDQTGETELRPSFTLRYYKVFNADQADWPEGSKLPATSTVEVAGADHDEAADAIGKRYLADGGPTLICGGDRAYYTPGADTVRVPERATFQSTEGYYSTLFHEFGHSTGHASRLDRKGSTEFTHFGSGTYAKEELVAEFASAFLLGVAGLNLDHADAIQASASYIQGWRQRLTEDPKLVVQAAAQAQHATDFILGERAADEVEAA